MTQENTIKIAVIDLDGVVADSSMRDQLARNSVELALGSLKNGMQYAERQSAWKAIFYSAGGLYNPQLLKMDEPIEHALGTIQRLIMHGWQIIFQSSRPEYTRLDTLEWLAKHFGMAMDDIPLVLQPRAARENFTRTPILKSIQLEAVINALNAAFVIYVDDDDKNREDVEKYAGHFSVRPYTLSVYAKLIDVIE